MSFCECCLFVENCFWKIVGDCCGWYVYELVDLQVENDVVECVGEFWCEVELCDEVFDSLVNDVFVGFVWVFVGFDEQVLGFSLIVEWNEWIGVDSVWGGEWGVFDQIDLECDVYGCFYFVDIDFVIVLGGVVIVYEKIGVGCQNGKI